MKGGQAGTPVGKIAVLLKRGADDEQELRIFLGREQKETNGVTDSGLAGASGVGLVNGLELDRRGSQELIRGTSSKMRFL
ncbi:hypothetical protein XENOCAPTIV_014893 [Xenoophorus captivus]|uniref:Uncharacterized protein n=1 Tax=Xenoophorus captivus TaxID=1517983 RepID=A0ABV0SFN8_9TELE